MATTISMDSRFPCSASALEALRSGDLERTAILGKRPGLALRVVVRSAHRMENRILARALGLENEKPRSGNPGASEKDDYNHLTANEA